MTFRGYCISQLASLISQKKKKKKKKTRKKKRFCPTSDQANLPHLLAYTPSLYPILFQDNDTFGFLIESIVQVANPLALLRFNAWFLTEAVPVAYVRYRSLVDAVGRVIQSTKHRKLYRYVLVLMFDLLRNKI